MEPLWNLVNLVHPTSLVLIATAVMVVWAAAQRALSHEKEAQRLRERHERDSSSSSEPPPESNIFTVDGSLAVIMPVASSVSLLLMFYFFASMSQVIAIATASAAVSSFAFFVSPLVSFVGNRYLDPCLGNRNIIRNRNQWILVIVSAAVLILWLISGHWLLNNLLGISMCIAFVTHIRLPNIKVCTMLLSCLFIYDIFWVFFSEGLFGQNVMVSVATQQASNPVHTVVDKLHLPGLSSITQKLEMPVKILVPRYLLGTSVPGGREFMMLGLGDMAIPGMLLALVVCFDYNKGRTHNNLDFVPKGGYYRYSWYAIGGYGVGLVCALAAGILSRMPQPALLYLVPSTLGPVVILAWMRKEFRELWSGPLANDKVEMISMV